MSQKKPKVITFWQSCASSLLLVALVVGSAMSAIAPPTLGEGYNTMPTEINLYTTAQVILSFVSGANTTRCDVSPTIPRPDSYKCTLTPTSIIFLTDYADRFTVQFRVYYNIPVNNSLIFAAFSNGSLVIQQTPFVYADTIDYTLTVSTTPAPHPATKDEIAAAILAQQQQFLDEQKRLNAELQTQQDRQWNIIIAQWIVIALLSIMVVIIFLRRHA